MRRLSLLVVMMCAGAAGIATLAPGTQASRPRIVMSPAVARLMQQLLNRAPLATPPGSRIQRTLRAVPGLRPAPQLLPYGYSCAVASGSCSLKPCIKFAGAAPTVQLGTVQIVGQRAVTVAPPSNSGCRSAPATVPASLPSASPQARPVGLPHAL